MFMAYVRFTWLALFGEARVENQVSLATNASPNLFGVLIPSYMQDLVSGIGIIFMRWI